MHTRHTGRRYATSVTGESTQYLASNFDGVSPWGTSGRIKKTADEMTRDINFFETTESILQNNAANRSRAKAVNAQLREQLAALQKENSETANRISGDVNLRQTYDRVGGDFGDMAFKRTLEETLSLPTAFA